MRHKRNPKKHQTQRANQASVGKKEPSLADSESVHGNGHNTSANLSASHLDASPSISPSISRASTPSTNASKTAFVRPSLALTKLQQEHRKLNEHGHRHDEEDVEDDGQVEPYSPNDPYFTSSQSSRAHAHHHPHHHHHHHHHHHQMIQDPGIEPADPQVIALWEQDLQSRLQQAYPRMCYYFLCDKSLFVLVTLLTIRRIDKADALRGGDDSLPSRRADRQYVDEIAQCMSEAELRFDKDEEWMTWWRETLLTVQQGLHRGWIGADSPNIVYAKDIMKLYRRFSKIAKRLAEAEAE